MTGQIFPFYAFQPLWLSAAEVQSPLLVLEEFFSVDQPKSHVTELRRWRHYVVHDSFYCDSRHGPGPLLFTYECNLRLVEAMYLLLVQNRYLLPETQDDAGSGEELVSAYWSIQRCFKNIGPEAYRELLHEWLRAALYPRAANESLSAAEIISLYDNLRRLYAAAWIIFEHASQQAAVSKIPATTAVADDKTKPDPLASLLLRRWNLNEEMQSILSGIARLIWERVPSVTHIWLLGMHEEPFTFYLIILVSDRETAPEHELASKVENSCRMLAPVQVILRRLSSAREAMKEGGRFWHLVAGHAPLVYHAQDARELPPAEQLRAANWLSAAQRDWQRWGRQSRAFLRSAENHVSQGEYGLALFLLHQAAESALMGFISAQIGYRLPVHNLTRKLRLTLLFDPSISAVLHLHEPEGAGLFQLLQRSYTEARYQLNFLPREEAVRLLFERVSLLLTRIEQAYDQFIAELALLSATGWQDEVSKEQ